MTEMFTLGKNNKFGNIDFNKLKSGITKKDLGIEEGSMLATIFDSIDTNKDGNSEGKLDRQELNAFMNIIKNLCGKDKNLSTREAKKYQINGDNLGKHKEELLNFIAKLSNLTEGIKNVTQSSTTNSEIITYEDGHTEEIFQDGSKIITISNGNKTIVKKEDKDGNLAEETVSEDGTEVKTEFQNGQKTKETKTTADAKEIVNYKDNKPTNKTICFSNGVIEEYNYENEKFVLKKRINPTNNEEVIFEGTRETNTRQNNGTKIVTITDNGTPISKTETRTNEDDQIEEKAVNWSLSHTL